MTDAQALHKLRTAPGYFLKHYPINPAGATLGILPNQANPAQFKIYKPNNPGGKLGHLGATRPGTVLPFLIHDISSFTIAPAANVPPFYGGAQFTALVVPMAYWDQIPLNLGAPDVGALDGYLLDGGADVMITGQLSNCCFRFVVNGAGLACTHRNPRGPLRRRFRCNRISRRTGDSPTMRERSALTAAGLYRLRERARRTRARVVETLRPTIER